MTTSTPKIEQLIDRLNLSEGSQMWCLGNAVDGCDWMTNGKQLPPMQAWRRVIYSTACHHEALLEPKLLQVHMTFEMDGMDIKRPEV